MEKITVDEMKQIELEIMDEFDRICRQEGIDYFIGYGTLLGAVRHGGFIPWDDDMDVLMLRGDYERFVSGFDRWRKGERFDLVNYRDEHSIYPFTKMVDVTTVVYENFVAKDIASGVWIDIFPLDDVDPADNAVFKRHARLELTRNFIVADPSVGSSLPIKLAKRIVCPFASKLDPAVYAAKVDENAKNAFGEGSSEVVADVVGEGKPRLRFPKTLFKPMEMQFEGRSYLAPEGFEQFLEIQYGDWKTPPAETDREIHVFEAYRL